MLYSRFLLVINFMFSHAYMSIPSPDLFLLSLSLLVGAAF